MARSIGKRNITLVRNVTWKEMKKVINSTPIPSDRDYSGVEDKVIEQLPVALWDTWEMADQEIRRIISDELMK